MNNPIYIIGAGAVGKALAVLLHKEGKEVKLIRGRAAEQGCSRRKDHDSTWRRITNPTRVTHSYTGRLREAGRIGCNHHQIIWQ